MDGNHYLGKWRQARKEQVIFPLIYYRLLVEEKVGYMMFPSIKAETNLVIVIMTALIILEVFFKNFLASTPAEAATEAGDPRQLGPSAVEKANPAVERTDKPVQVTSEAVNVDTRNAPSSVEIKGDNITLNVGGESFARVLEKAFKGMVLGGIAGSVVPGAGTAGGAAVGGSAGIGKGILDEFQGKDFQKLKESFKEGQERAIHDMSPEGIQANRKAFMDRSGITRRADELNRGSATMGMPVDVNQPGLYTGGRMEAPQGIGGAGGHFGVGGITMPETPGGLGVRGIGGASGAGPAFQQHGLSGGPIRVQPRQGAAGVAEKVAVVR